MIGLVMIALTLYGAREFVLWRVEKPLWVTAYSFDGVNAKGPGEIYEDAMQEYERWRWLEDSGVERAKAKIRTFLGWEDR
jgi:hypothetical protein